jgi:26S proteasome regulatory subunit N12
MHLLVDNRLLEFHAELELSTGAEASNPFVSFPINLERHLMMGIYDESLNVQVPDPSYQFLHHPTSLLLTRTAVPVGFIAMMCLPWHASVDCVKIIANK